MATLPVPERIHLSPEYSISRIIVGGWQFSKGHGAQGSLGTDPVDLFSRLVELGFTTFDCADIYQGVEEFLGGVLKRSGRGQGGKDIQIHTKFVPDLAILPTIDRSYVEGIINRSLTRLGVERLDLLQFHWWDYSIPGYREVAHWLNDLRIQGKIRHLGVTNFDQGHLAEIVSDGVPVLSNQVQNSVLDGRPGRGLSEYCESQGISLLCYGALSGGFLTDQYMGMGREPAEAANRSLIKYRLIIDELGGWEVYQDILGSLGSVARRHETGTVAVALRWVLDQAQVAATITGVDSVSQARELMTVFGLSLDDDDRQAILSALARTVGPNGPVYALERDREGPHGRIMRYNLNKE